MEAEVEGIRSSPLDRGNDSDVLPLKVMVHGAVLVDIGADGYSSGIDVRGEVGADDAGEGGKLIEISVGIVGNGTELQVPFEKVDEHGGGVGNFPSFAEWHD